jgi:putative membrane protein
MTGNTNRIIKLSLALACVSALGACKSNDRTASADTAAARTDSAAGRLDTSTMSHNVGDSTGSMANNTANSGANGAGSWTNDHIFGFTHNADNGEIAMGKLASTKATNPQVKAYAKEMVKDHTQMMSQAHALMTKLKAMPDSTWGDAQSLATDAKSKHDELNG